MTHAIHATVFMPQVPCFISALLQCSILSALFAPDERVLVLTANESSLSPHMPRLLSLCHVTKPEQQARFLIAGCEDMPHFGEALANGQAVDVPKVRKHSAVWPFPGLMRKPLKLQAHTRRALPGDAECR